MNKSLLKFITDFGPLLIFFVVYSKSGKNLSTAIPPLIAATIIAVLASYIVEKKIPYVPLDWWNNYLFLVGLLYTLIIRYFST